MVTILPSEITWSHMPDPTPRYNPLEERYSQEILLALLGKERMMKTDLLRSVSRSSCMSGRLDRLEEAGLVTVRVDNFSNNTKWVSLTPKGEMVAEILKDLFRILFDDGPCDVADCAHASCYETLEGEFAQTIHTADRSRPDDGEHRTRQK